MNEFNALVKYESDDIECEVNAVVEYEVFGCGVDSEFNYTVYDAGTGNELDDFILKQLDFNEECQNHYKKNLDIDLVDDFNNWG